MLAYLLCATAQLHDELVEIFHAADVNSQWAALSSEAHKIGVMYASIRSLLFVAIPIIFDFGVQLREAEWSKASFDLNTSLRIHTHSALTLLLSLTHHKTGRREYVDAVTVSSLVHTPTLDFYNCGVHTEESCEAGLSRLVRALRTTTETVAQHSDIYTLLGAAGAPLHLSHQNISPGNIHKTKVFLCKALTRVAKSEFTSWIFSPKVTTINPAESTKSCAELPWPVAHLSVAPSAIEKSLTRSLLTLVKTVKIPVDLSAYCAALPAGEVQERMAVIKQIKQASVQIHTCNSLNHTLPRSAVESEAGEGQAWSTGEG